MTEILALIPARGGSKGLPRKNVLPLAGKPLIAHTIATALDSSTITRTIVSTDDEEIARRRRARTAPRLPFMRPAELAADDSLDLEVFQHALAWLARRRATSRSSSSTCARRTRSGARSGSTRRCGRCSPTRRPTRSAR